MTYSFKFGRMENLEQDLPVIRSLEDRFRHTYILGGTGTGKTSLMMRMALHDISQGYAVIFIEPKGEHTQALYNLIPDKDRVIYFSYRRPSLVINPLRKPGCRVNDMADEFAEILDIVIKQTSPANPPASENMKEIIIEAIKAIKEPDRNLGFLYDFLRYPEVRQEYLKKHGASSRYWANFDIRRPGKEADEVATARRISVRLNKFVNDERFRRIVTGENQLDIDDIAKNRRVILVDTSGMAMDKRIYITALFSFAMKSYCEFDKEKHDPLMFYLDECWMGINDTFQYLLSFARSYRIGVTLAHQYINQFPRFETVKMMLSICNTKVAFFPAGADEARVMAEIYGLEQQDFRNLEKYQAWVRIGNKNTLIKTYPPPQPERHELPSEIPDAAPAKPRAPAVNFLRDCWFTC